VDDDWPVPGDLLAFRYRLISLLETGGMAQIWRGHDELLGRPVALKLPTAAAAVPESARKEARTAARLQHPAIAAVHDYQEAVRPDGSLAPFVVMELLDGETLAARLDRGPLTWQAATPVAAAVAEALAAAHAGGVVHRDIKPGNVMLTSTGVKIMDFGISAATGEPDDDETGATFGTPAYVAPERFDGQPAEPATDMYGLGVLLFEMVTGDPPHPVDTWEELAAARANRPAELPVDLPAALRDLVRRCLAGDPGHRPTAVEARRRLAGITTGTPTETAPEPGAARPGATAREARVSAERGGPALIREGRQPDAAPRPSASGRAPAVTLRLGRPARRRTAARAGVVVAALAVAGVFVAVGSSNRTDQAEPEPPALTLAPTTRPAPSLFATLESRRPSPSPTRTTRPTLAPPPPLGLDDAVGRVRSAVEAGQAVGQIRPDVATDLLNLLGPLGGAEPAEVGRLVDDLRRKIEDRVDEGTVARSRAAVLRSRLSDLDRAAGT
jgi:hypothetical protein